MNKQVMLSLAVLIVGATVSQASACDVRWASSAKVAWEKTQKEKRLLLLYLEAPQCQWCDVMKRNTYCHPQVAQVINRSFVPIVVQHHEATGLIEKLGIRSYPTTLVISPDQKVLDQMTGYLEAEPFRQRLENIERLTKQPR